MSTKKLQILGSLGDKIYKQNEEPIGAEEGALWVNLDGESVLKIKKNGAWEDITGVSEHTHTKDDITNFPSSLPADGGNADTLDGKHADDFATDQDLKDLIDNWIGDEPVGDQISGALENLEIPESIYVQNDEPYDIEEGTLWLDMDNDREELLTNAVLYVSQILSDEQKAQARENLGIDELGVDDYNDLKNKPVIPTNVTAVEHQYAATDFKDRISNVETWEVLTGAQTNLSKRVRACIYANGYYVACGLNAELGYSTDGITWTVVEPFADTSLALTNITYGKGKFVVLDQNGNLFAAEETPKTWTKVCDASYWPNGVGSLVYANNQFVAAGDGFAAFSEDCTSWTIVEVEGEFNQIAFGNGLYVAVGAGGAVSVSHDGRTWKNRSNPDVTGDLRAAVFAKGRWFIGGINGTIMYTEDFVNWGIATSNSDGVRYVRAIFYMENKFYAACYNSSPAKGEIWVSDDGMTWTVQHQQDGMLWCLSANDGRLITAGDSGCVCVLDLGIEWFTKQPELEDGQYMWERIVFTLSDGGKVVSDGVCISNTAGGGGALIVTYDADTKKTSHSTSEIKDAYDAGRLVVLYDGKSFVNLIEPPTSNEAYFCGLIHCGNGKIRTVAHSVLNNSLLLSNEDFKFVTQEYVDNEVDKLLIVTATINEDGVSYTASHSPAEIEDAKNAGKLVVLDIDGMFVALELVSAEVMNTALFSRFISCGDNHFETYEYRIGESNYVTKATRTYTYATREYVDKVCNTKILIDATSGDKSVDLSINNNNTEWRYLYASGITSLTISSTGDFSSESEAYYSIMFLSGTTATTIVNNIDAYFTGDDCVEGVFTPASSKTYDLGIWWNGIKWQAVVRGSV